MTKRGRPAREPTEAEREKVKELLALKSPISDIATMLGYSKPTFRKYFSAEIFSAKKSQEPKKEAPKITDALREKVIRYIGCQMTVEQVADAIDYTVEDLKEYFAAEIEKGQAKYRAKVVDHLDAQMTEGVSGATNRLEAMTAVPLEAPGTVAGGHVVGKKAAAKTAAGHAAAAGGRFAPRPAPRIAVDNTK